MPRMAVYLFFIYTEPTGSDLIKKPMSDNCGLPITSHGHYLTHVKHICTSLAQ